MSYIVVVDDNPLNAKLARIVLARAGHDIVAVGSAREAMAAIGRRMPDVVVTDISMPEVSGVQLCSDLRARYPDSGLRIVAYTALAAGDELAAITGAGFDATVTKPATKESLLAAVQAGPIAASAAVER